MASRSAASGSEADRTVQEVTFDLSGWNVNLGLIAHPTENVNLGFVYKWAFEGDVTLSRRRYDPDLPVTSATGSPTLSFPAAVGVGLSWRPISPLTVSTDFTRSYWSEGHIYDYFELGPPPSSYPPTTYPDKLYPTLVEITGTGGFGPVALRSGVRARGIES